MKYENNRSGNGGVFTLHNEEEEVGRLTYTIFPEENKFIISFRVLFLSRESGLNIYS